MKLKPKNGRRTATPPRCRRSKPYLRQMQHVRSSFLIWVIKRQGTGFQSGPKTQVIHTEVKTEKKNHTKRLKILKNTKTMNKNKLLIAVEGNYVPNPLDTGAASNWRHMWQHSFHAPVSTRKHTRHDLTIRRVAKGLINLIMNATWSSEPRAVPWYLIPFIATCSCSKLQELLAWIPQVAGERKTCATD